MREEVLFGPVEIQAVADVLGSDRAPEPWTMTDQMSFLQTQTGRELLSTLSMVGILPSWPMVGQELNDRSWPGMQAHCWNFSSSKMAGLNLKESILYGCGFSSAEMAGARLEGSRFEHCVFVGTVLTGARLHKTVFNRSSLGFAVLHRVKAQEASFDGAWLSNAGFDGAHLQEASFVGAVAQKTNFVGTNLRAANFTDAQLHGANFTDADIHGANFTGATFSTSTIWPNRTVPKGARLLQA